MGTFVCCILNSVCQQPLTNSTYQHSTFDTCVFFKAGTFELCLKLTFKLKTYNFSGVILSKGICTFTIKDRTLFTAGRLMFGTQI